MPVPRVDLPARRQPGRGARAPRASSFDKPSLGLKPVEVREWHGWVFVDRTGRGRRLRGAHRRARGRSWRRTTRQTLVTPVVARVRRGGQLEGDHRELPGVLPLLDDPPRAVPGEPARRAARTSSGTATGSAAGWTCATARETMSLDGRSGGVAIARLDEHEKRTVMYVAVLPNLLISLHPDYVMTHLLTPLAPDRTRIRCSWAFPAEVGERRGLRPGVRRGLLGPDQPPGLVGLRVGAARDEGTALRARAAGARRGRRLPVRQLRRPRLPGIHPPDPLPNRRLCSRPELCVVAARTHGSARKNCTARRGW